MKAIKSFADEQASAKTLNARVPVWTDEAFAFSVSNLDYLSSEHSRTPFATALPGHGLGRAGVHDVLLVDLSHTIDLGLSSLKIANTESATTVSSTGTVLSTYTSGKDSVADQNEYNVTISFKGTWTSDLQQAFIAAADRISGIIADDVNNVTVHGGGKPVKVDDIVITAELKPIDGVGNVLGQAGPTAIRSTSYLPASATMQFDSADAQYYAGQHLWDEIVLHEMLHSIGFGSIWGYKALVSNGSYTGAHALAEYSHIGGTPFARSIPLETGGGSGTAGSHWSETVFKNELMTGYLNDPNGADPKEIPNADPLSSMSVASLWDLGYGMRSVTGYDPYSLV